jgi:dipeptidyl aminopeptidase/acylaminoacyl peptidase
MKAIRFLMLAVFCLLLGGISFAQNTSQPFRLTDLQKLQRLSTPAISPDGKTIAVVVSKPDWKTDKNKQVLKLIEVSDATSRDLTFKRESLSNVRWSPDGTRLAFIAKDVNSKKTQIFVMPMNGGDAVRITNSKTGIDEFSWSPDGEKIAFVAQDTVPNPKAIKHGEDAFRVSDNHFLVRKIPQPWHIWMVSSNGGKAKRLTQGSWSLQTDQGSMSRLAWTNDGKAIAFQKFPDVWEGNAYTSVVAMVDTAGKKVTTLIAEAGSGDPAFSPVGSQMAFMRARKGDLNNGQAVYLMDGDKITDITAGLARNIRSYRWLPDGTLLLSGYKGTRSVYWLLSTDGKTKQLTWTEINPSRGVSVANDGTIAFTATTSLHPQELYVYKKGMEAPRQLTHFNAFTGKLALGKSAAVNWKLGKFHEDGVLTYPPVFEKGKKYPLVLLIHGGPESASILSFSPLAQLLAAKGFLVFQPNYRGSTNLGDTYQHAIYRNTGKGPGQDVMAGVKKLLSMGIVDKSKIGVTGWSYGGYMTSWLIGNYPDVWKAAVSGAALNDWVADYTVSYYQKGDLYFFGGSPWVKSHWKIWREQSPIAYATKVKAPTLIMGDVGDPNVPLLNGYQLFHALRDNGVTVEFYAYPVDTHFPHDIVRSTDVYRRWVDWMVKYLK